MTRVKKKWSRETDSAVFEKGKNRQVIVTLEPGGVIGFRLKGTRKTYSLTTGRCHMMALKASILQEKREKSKRKMNAKRGITF